MNTRLLICGLIAVLAGSARAESPESVVAASARTFAAPPSLVFVSKTAGASTWSDLLHKIGRGQYAKPFGDDNPIGTFGLANVRPNVTRDTGTPHKADYINLWGAIGEDEKFHPAFVTLVSEDWQALKDQSSKPDVIEGCKNSKCFYVDQWLFTLELDGSLRKRGDKYVFSHLFVIENTDGRVWDSGAVQPFATDDQGKAKLATLIKQWHAFEAH